MFTFIYIIYLRAFPYLMSKRYIKRSERSLFCKIKVIIRANPIPNVRRRHRFHFDIPYPPSLRNKPFLTVTHSANHLHLLPRTGEIFPECYFFFRFDFRGFFIDF